MKPFNLTTILLLAAVVAFASCDNDGGKKAAGSGVSINGVYRAGCNTDVPGRFAVSSRDAGMSRQYNRKTNWNLAPPTASFSTGATWDTVGNSRAAVGDPYPAGWRVSAVDEQEALRIGTKVTKIWTKIRGVSGCKFTDRNSGTSVFLSATGCRGVFNGLLSYVNVYGCYWSSSLSPPFEA